jgi:hypothetical protein
VERQYTGRGVLGWLSPSTDPAALSTWCATGKRSGRSLTASAVLVRVHVYHPPLDMVCIALTRLYTASAGTLAL